MNTDEEMKNQILSVINQMRSMSQKQLVNYDIKNQSQGFASENGGLKSLCLYYLTQEDFDCDVALFSIISYRILYDSLLTDYVIQRQPKSTMKYELINKEPESLLYRGDTINSFSTTVHEFLRTYDYDEKEIRNVLTGKNNRNGKRGTLFQYNGLTSEKNWEICILDNYKYFSSIFSERAISFFNINHTLGNMMICPTKPNISFNLCRGNFMRAADYWDIALLCIYNHFFSIPSDYCLKWLLKDNNTIVSYTTWLNESFGSREDGWKKYIETNFLEDMVDKDNKPLALWKGHFENIKNILPSTNEHFESYFEKSSYWIEQRGNKIAAKLKKYLDEKSDEEILSLLL